MLGSRESCRSRSRRSPSSTRSSRWTSAAPCTGRSPPRGSPGSASGTGSTALQRGKVRQSSRGVVTRKRKAPAAEFIHAPEVHRLGAVPPRPALRHGAGPPPGPAHRGPLRHLPEHAPQQRGRSARRVRELHAGIPHWTLHEFLSRLSVPSLGILKPFFARSQPFQFLIRFELIRRYQLWTRIARRLAEATA